VSRYQGMRTAARFSRLARSRGVRAEARALSRDVSHRHSVARGSAYWHMLANPWTEDGVRLPSLVAMGTSLVRSQTRTTFTSTAGNSDVLINVMPGLYAQSASSAPESFAKITIVQIDGSNVVSGLARTPDKNQTFLSTCLESYRPIAMGVRLINLTAADGVAGCVFGRLRVDPPGFLPADPVAADLSVLKNDPTAYVRPWGPDRELRFVWHPANQDNSMFTPGGDRGPEANASAATVPHQRSPMIVLGCVSSGVQTLEIEVVTWYEYVPLEAFRDVLDVEMAVISSADVAAATGAAGSAAMHPVALTRPTSVSNALASSGVTSRVAAGAVAAARAPFDAAAGVVMAGAGVVDSVLGARVSRRVPHARNVVARHA